MSYLKEKTSAIDAITKACHLVERLQPLLSEKEIFKKQDASPVTLADLCSQAVINLSLLHAFPSCRLMGEEDTSFLRENPFLKERFYEELHALFPSLQEEEFLDALDAGQDEGGGGCFWTIDPIDGTKGFLRKEHYAVALALIDEGEVKVGVIGCPQLEEGSLFYAVAGQGAFFRSLKTGEERPLKIDPNAFASDELVYCEPHFFSKTHSHERAYTVACALRPHVKPVRVDSQVKYPLVALNIASYYVRFSPKGSENIWDHAAGALIVEEAGGKVTDSKGFKINYALGRKLLDNTGVLASNGLLHAPLIKQMNSI